MAVTPPAYAALLAGSLSLIELLAGRKKRLSWRAMLWVLLRVSIDGSTGALAYAVLLVVFRGLDWFTAPWPVIIAGMAGPTILRSQLSFIGSGHESNTYGPANVFMRLQKMINDQIDDVSSAAQTNWLHGKALTKIQQLNVTQLAARARSYWSSLDRMSEMELKEHLKYVEEVAGDTAASDESKQVAIVQRLLDTGGRRCVRGLMRTASKSRKQP